MRKNKQLQEKNKTFLMRIEELENRLKLNSHNSSKPRSSDGLRKKQLACAKKRINHQAGKLVIRAKRCFK